MSQAVDVQPVALEHKGADNSALWQLARLPWTRQLDLLSDNERCDLPGFEGASPSKNLTWLLMGFDSNNQCYPASQLFNCEEPNLSNFELVFFYCWIETFQN